MISPESDQSYEMVELIDLLQIIIDVIFSDYIQPTLVKYIQFYNFKYLK